MTLSGVPIIDIAPFRSGSVAARRTVATAVDEACRQIGFLVIAGHGVPASLIAETEAVSRLFFDLPLAEKMTVKRPAPDVTRGYIPVLAESVGRSRGEAAPGDINESFMIGPIAPRRRPISPGQRRESISPPISGRPRRRHCGRYGANITG